MGAYLDKPKTEKESETGDGNGLKYAATTMQGWRINQEDAHNCVIGLAEEWSIFAVYDGHGGSEVAKYTADKFPEFLKSKEFWKSDDVEAILKNVFVEFDDVLRSEDCLKELKKLANEGKEQAESGHNSEDEMDRIETLTESRMPLEQLLSRYGYAIDASSLRKGVTIKNLVDAANEDREEDSNADDCEEADNTGEVVKKEKKRHCKSPANDKPKRAKTEEEGSGSSTVVVDGTDSKAKGDGDLPSLSVYGVEKVPNLLTNGEPSESQSGTKADIDGAEVDSDDADSSFSEGDEEDDGEDVADEDDEDDDGEDAEQIYLPGGGEVPGEDSGTTACVCLMSKDTVVVANAGDSRAVLCRAGKALDLSVDHKPEDEVEKTRIEKAGGAVNEDGRVNGGLNLSRAFGDHCYKKNADLPLAEQMISALPDIKIEKLTAEDEFLVVACDGIWNSMESQEVVDFVRKMFAEEKSCQEIAEALCDACLSESTAGDGTGCDNMTVIVTQISH